MRSILTLSLVFSTIRLATPLVWAALGGLYSGPLHYWLILLNLLVWAGAGLAGRAERTRRCRTRSARERHA